ncbi:uncharacterized protein LOC135338196 [Halichondria panicea]|uniref:uncharacterized protein LOC135338196 n=1 Tax=Halichondria panicea TaxID=6063 RepID=UPI00312B778D
MESPEDCGQVKPQQTHKNTTIESVGYYDIMIIGRSGMGKTTTADKILIANPEGIDYQSKYPSRIDEALDIDHYNQIMKLQDLCMWQIPNDLQRVDTRMKKLASYRTLIDHPAHLSINEARKEVNERTLKSELFSNETTKVRVLDVRGFFSPVSNVQIRTSSPNCQHPSTARALNIDSSHLGTMRNILHIQAAMSMKFARVLYFLPSRDTLEDSSADLQPELELMFYYFGRAIFDTMVIVATLGPVSYKMFKHAEVTFPDDELERSQVAFQAALKKFIPVDTPNPPIIFVSLNESCESILEKVKQTEVAYDSLRLQLKSTVCARCSVTIGEQKGERVATTSCSDWSQSIIYEDSQCHPLMVPKYTTLQKIAGGISYTVKTVAKGEPWNWPDFSVEECAACGRPPGSHGCTKIFTEYVIDGETYVIDHNNKVEENAFNHQKLFQEDSGIPTDSPSPEPPNPDDIPSPDSDGGRRVQSDALVSVFQRKQHTIRPSVSLSRISTTRTDARLIAPTPRPRTKLNKSTNAIEIVSNPQPSISAASMYSEKGYRQSEENAPSEVDIEERVFKQQVTVDVEQQRVDTSSGIHDLSSQSDRKET